MTGMGERGMGAFRHTPPSVRSSWIERTRLQQRLGRRFELDVMLVAAPAGYGKTAALARAISNNEQDPAGTDLWLQCTGYDSDASVLGAAFLRSTGLDVGPDEWSGDVAEVADALLRLAPNQTCLIIDDLHVIEEGSSGMALLQELVDTLPGHAHLLLAGRTVAPLRLARLRIDGRCEQLGLDDFEFDDEEMDRALAGRSGSAVTRWPAMTSLVRNDRPDASVDYLLEEVASALGPKRLASLTALSYLRDVDDGLASAATDSSATAAKVLADLPLVLRSPGGSFQMHDLWRSGLTRGDSLSAAASEALVRVAKVLLARGSYVLATEQFVRAGHSAGVEEAALEFVGQPLMFAAAAELRAMADLTDRFLGDAPLGHLLQATVPMVGDEQTSAEAFHVAADVARAAGDEAVEIIALQNVTNLRAVMNSDIVPDWLTERVDEVASGGSPRALALQATLRSFRSRAEGRPEDAARELGLLNPLASEFEQVLFAFGMGDLGRPEEVAAPAAVEDTSAAASQAGGQYLAQAIWLRGDVSPELALELGSDLVNVTEARGVAHVRISTSSVLSLVASTAGDAAAARRFADRALALVSQTVSPTVRAFAVLADAATLLAEQGEEAAAKRIATALDILPVGAWPPRPYLYALPLIHALAPETRPVIDGCRFGPALTGARDAAIALAALRDDGDPAPAAALPWHRAWVLRAHVMPPYLADLAAAAASVGRTEVNAVIEQTPQVRLHLLSVAERKGHPGAAWAAGRAAQLPARPDHDISIGLLGPLKCDRGGVAVTDAGWVRRDRVRQLLTYLLLHARTTRRQAAEVLWPDLPTEKALANLRVNLSHLQRVLEPGRSGAERPWFVRSDGEFIEVHTDGLTVDTEQFERTCSQARRLDDVGQGTRAIALYRDAAATYRGDYAVDWPDAPWADLERLRLRTLAVSSVARLGELLLARGEPEEAGGWASRVIRIEPLDERSHRLFAQSLAAQGNRAGAWTSLRTLTDRLAEEGLSVERETERLAATFLADRSA